MSAGIVGINTCQRHPLQHEAGARESSVYQGCNPLAQFSYGKLHELVLLRLVGEISLQLLIIYIQKLQNFWFQQQRLCRKCAQRCTSASGISSGTTYANFSCSRVNFLNKVCIRVKASDAGFVEATRSLPDIAGAATGAGVHRQMCIKYLNVLNCSWRLCTLLALQRHAGSCSQLSRWATYPVRNESSSASKSRERHVYQNYVASRAPHGLACIAGCLNHCQVCFWWMLQMLSTCG